MAKVKYIQLESGAYPSDHVWLAMSAEERGIYHSLIIFLSCEGGSLPSNPKKLSALCNVSEKKYKKFWAEYGHKFLEKEGKILHKRVSAEITKARKLIKQRSLAGKASAESRRTTVERPLNGRSTGRHFPVERREGNVTERKEKKYTNDTNKPTDYQSSFSRSDSTDADMVKFYDLVCELFHVTRQNDRTTIRQVGNHLKLLAENGKPDAFKLAWKMAFEIKKNGKARKPIAVFVAKMQTEMALPKAK